MSSRADAGDGGIAARPPYRSDLLNLCDHGAQRFRRAVAPDPTAVTAALARLPDGRAGTRIGGIGDLAGLLSSTGAVGAIAAARLGPACRPVRAILFDKTARANWALGWHQDRTICVRRRVDVPGFGPWTIKAGMPHVAPPVDLLARMLTLRMHIDDVPETNAPLLIAPGSHREGMVPVDAIDGVVRKYGVRACPAEAGDVWAYATLILHASAAATLPGRRRVLQCDFAAEDLPGGLEWLGVAG